MKEKNEHKRNIKGLSRVCFYGHDLLSTKQMQIIKTYFKKM